MIMVEKVDTILFYGIAITEAEKKQHLLVDGNIVHERNDVINACRDLGIDIDVHRNAIWIIESKRVIDTFCQGPIPIEETIETGPAWRERILSAMATIGIDPGDRVPRWYLDNDITWND